MIEANKDLRICLHPHPEDERLDHSLVKHINMETMLAVQLSAANTAIQSALAALSAANGNSKRDGAVKAAIEVLREALP